MVKLILFSLFMLVVTNSLVAQTTFTATQGTTRQYHIDSKPTITSYNWQVYDDSNLSSLTSTSDVTVTSLGAGHEHEIEVTWNSLGTYYLNVSVLGTDGCSNIMTFEFNVIADHLPVLANDSNSTIETNIVHESDGSGNILANDTDADDDVLTVASVNGNVTGTVSGIYGTLSWNSNGTYTYTPNSELDTLYLGESVIENFTVTVSDGVGGNANSILTITINGENANPVAVNDTNLTTETIAVNETNGSGNLLANDTDIDGDILGVASIDGVSASTGTVSGTYGSLSFNSNGTYTYTPNSGLDTLRSGENVIETFTVTVSDGKGGNTTSTLTITINGINAIPVLVADTNETDETVVVTESTTNSSGNLLANDSDVDGETLHVINVNGNTSGTYVGLYGSLSWFSNGSYTYVPNSALDTLTAIEILTEVFTYSVADGSGGSGNSTLTITINGVNAIPILVDDTNSTIKSGAISETDGSGNLLSNDIDHDGDLLTVTSVEGVLTSTGSVSGIYGTLTWNANGTYTYTPNPGLDSLDAGESVIEIFTYRADDPYGGYDTAALTITINGDNDAPVLANDTNRTNETTPVTQSGVNSSGNLLANDTDPNSDALTITQIDGVLTGIGTVNGTYGKLTWTAGGNYTYTPNVGLDSLNAGENVVDVFTYTASDGKGGMGTANLTVTVNGVNDAPILANDTNSTVETASISETDGSGSLLSNDSDPNGNTLIVTLVDGVTTAIGTINGTYGTLTWLSDGTYAYVPNSQLDTLKITETIYEIFTYTVSDGLGGTANATLTITISGANTAPVLVNDTNSTIEKNIVTEADGSGNILANDSDIDTDVLAISSIDGNASGTLSGIYGTLVWNTVGNYTYTPNSEMDTLFLGEVVNEIFTVSVTDGNGVSANSTLTITITGQNAAPFAVNDANNTTEITVINSGGTLLGNDSDIDHDQLRVWQINNNTTGSITGVYGTLTWNSNGTYIYTPNLELDSLVSGEDVQDIFTYSCGDGLGGTDDALLVITINGVNAAPVLANDINSTIQSAAINESNGSGALLANDIDVDGDLLTISQINGIPTSTGTITGTYGTLVWSANGTYVYTPNVGMDTLIASENVQEVFTYTGTDGVVSGTATLTITISGANVAPVLANDINSTVETAVINQSSTGSSGNIIANDTDDNGDALTITQVNGVPTSTGTINGTYGKLTWRANGTYTYTPNAELDSLKASETLVEVFAVTVTDGHGESGNSTLTITIHGVNNLPLLVNDTNTTIETIAVTESDGSGNILSNDTDAEGATLTITQISGNTTGTLTGTYGTLSWNPNGTYTYSPNPELDSLKIGENVLEEFTVTVSDGDGGIVTSSLKITINGQNVAPVAANDTNSTTERAVITNSSTNSSGVLLGNDTDIDNDALRVWQINGNTANTLIGTYGTLVWSDNGTYTYTPNTGIDSLMAGESVQEIFTYSCGDGHGGTDDATLTITINGQNAVPVLVNDTNLTTETAPVNEANGSGNLLANDTDADGETLSILSIDGNVNGTLVSTYGTLTWNSNGTYNYTPNSELDSLAAGENVTEVFTYTATDGTVNRSATLTITIRGANSNPQLVADTNATIHTTAVDELDGSGNLLANDTDPDGDALTVYSIGGELTGTTIGTYGSLIWNPDGTYTYIPNAGMDTLTSHEVVYEVLNYVARDGKGGSSANTLTITISGINTPPVLANDANTTIKSTPVTSASGSGNLLANDTDPDADPLSVITVNGDNTSTVTGTYGTLVWNADGNYTYTPDAGTDTLSAGESLTEVFTYTVTDGSLTRNATLTIVMNGVNSAPVLADDTNLTIEKSPVSEADGSGNLLSNDTDPDDDFLIVSAINGNTTGAVPGNYGTLTWSTNGTYTYTPSAALDTLTQGELVVETFIYTVSDGNGGIASASLRITITGDNQAPLAADDTNTTTEGVSVSESNGNGNILANDTDVDGDILSISTINGKTELTVAGTYGTIYWNNNGTYTYIPNGGLDSLDAGENVIEVFNVIVTDGLGKTSLSLLSITINGINANLPPVANADFVNVNEDAQNVPINVLSNDTDPNNDLLTITLVESPVSGGTVTLNGNTIIYNPPANFNGRDYFAYRVCDNGTPSLCDLDTVFVTVEPVNDAPVAYTDVINAFAGSSDVSIDALQNDIDIDGDVLTASIVSAPTSGGTAVVSNNLIVYNPPADFTGIDTILYQVCDNGAPSLCDIDTVFVHLVDQLTAVDDVLAVNSGSSGSINLLANDTYVANANFKIIKEPSHGTYALYNKGGVTYYASDSYSGLDTIVYVISDNISSDTAILVITINPTMVLLTTTYCVDEVPYYSWNVEANGIEISSVDLAIYNLSNELVESLDDVALTGSRVWPGSAALSSGALFNVPAILQTINIEIVVNNNDGEVLTSVLDIPDCHVNMVHAVWDSITVYGEETIIDVLANDEDPDEGDIDTSSVSIYTTLDFDGPYHGEAFVNSNGTISYIPDPGYIGVDSFIYRVCDNYAERACDTAMVRLNVLYNDKLVANNDRFTVYQNQPNILDVANNDYDPEDMLDLTSIVILVEPENGTVIVNGDGTVTYQSSTTFTGTDQFEYVICDNGLPKDCDTAWVYVSVNENQCIVAKADNAITTVNESVTVSVLENDFDFENQIDSISLQLVSVADVNGPNHGTVTINPDKTITYMPDNLFAGIDSFIYSICDGGYPQCCDTAVVYVNVIDSNVGIVANRDDVTTPQNNSVVITVLRNDYDPDGVIDTSSITIVTPPAEGSAQINSTGTITYTPNNNFNGIDSIIYQICDNGPIVSCDTAVVYINVVENLPPVAVNDTFDAQWGQNETHDIRINDYDPEGALDSASVKITVPPVSGGISVDPITGIISYMPDYCSTSLDSFTYVIYDIQGNVSNEAKVLIHISIDTEGDYDMDGIPDVVEDLNLNGNPCDDDTDGDGIANFQDNDDDDDGVLTINEDVVFPNGDPTDDDTDGDGIPNYLDDDDDNDCSTTAEEVAANGGSYLFDLDRDGIPNYLDNDDNGNGILSCDEGEDLDQNGVPDWNEIWSPHAANDVLTIGQDETIVFNVSQVLENDSTQMDSITFQVIVDPNNGILNIDFDNWTITYTPNFDFIGVDSFRYVVCDFRGMNCDTATVIINVEDIIVVPELFTPNNDGENDRLIITGLDRYSWDNFEVYNRWGNKVYEKENYDGEWDGYSNVNYVVGKNQLPVGVYYYIVQYGERGKKTGALFLKR